MFIGHLSLLTGLFIFEMDGIMQQHNVDNNTVQQMNQCTDDRFHLLEGTETRAKSVILCESFMTIL